MNVAYVTPFYNGACDGRYGRFLDWIHTLRDMDRKPFEFDVHAVMATNPDQVLWSHPPQYLGSASDLWATKRNNLETLLNLPRLHRDLKMADPDIVHLTAFDPLLIPLLISATRDVPVVLGPNVGGWYPQRNEDIWVTSITERAKLEGKFRLRKRLVSQLDYAHVLSFSEYHKGLIGLLGVDEADITPLRPGVERIFSPGEEPNQRNIDPPHELLYVGDFSDHKGYEVFLRAISRLNCDVRACLVGPGDPNQDLIQTLGLTDVVTVEGFVERSDLPGFYRSADLFVLPSTDETGPNTLVEALASGTPVVATDTDGINEYETGEAAVYFWPREPEALAEALESALDDIDSLTTAARENAHEFQASVTVDQLDSLYRRIL